jgi:hypothetical protein
MNSTDQLKAALDRNVDKEMAIEALHESRGRNLRSREESGHFLSSINEAIAEQGYEHDDSGVGRADKEQAGEEMELELNL